MVRGDQESLTDGDEALPGEFKADAVALYRSRPGATIAQIADDLGVNRETLRSWVRADDQRRGASGGPAALPAAGSVEDENAALRRRVRELEEERDILRKAARYFAGGYTATTPSDATHGSDSNRRSPTRRAPGQRQLRWPRPHKPRVQDQGSSPVRQSRNLCSPGPGVAGQRREVLLSNRWASLASSALLPRLSLARTRLT